MHKESVKYLASIGMRVFPIFEPVGDQCACGDPQCSKPGKHPRVRKWPAAATTNAAQIERWWDQWPEANVAIATGNGLVVIDIDGPTGEEQARELELPVTAEATTGRGRHLYFRGSARTQAGLFPGIDIRGEGGYIIAPPSSHISGARYEWVRPLLPVDRLPEVPSWVEEARSSSSGPLEAVLTGTIHEGQRYTSLFRRACCIQSKNGLQPDELLAVLRVQNERDCDPPLEETEVVSIVEGASRYRNEVFDDEWLLARDLTPHELAIVLALRTRVNEFGLAIMSYDQIAAITGMHRRTVIKLVKGLERRGILEVERPPKELWTQHRIYEANKYVFRQPDATESFEQTLGEAA